MTKTNETITINIDLHDSILLSSLLTDLLNVSEQITEIYDTDITISGSTFTHKKSSHTQNDERIA